MWDEREQLHEPADQISLDSFDTIDLVDDIAAEITTEHLDHYADLQKVQSQFVNYF